jgi:phosphatidylcholine synthase
MTLRRRRIIAWAVHAYTAAGLVLAALAAVLIVAGTDAALRTALLLFLLATLIDASDGCLARRAGVSQVLPGFDGRRLDDIVDFHTYTSLPLLLIWRSGALPGAAGWLLLLPLLASAYGFSQTDAKTPDGYFLGFPSYWNVVAFYIFFLGPAPWLTAAVLLVLAALTFVPVPYLYPSTGGTLNRVTAAAAVLWGVVLLLILTGAAQPPVPWTVASLAFPAWYMGASWTVALRGHRGRGAGG